MRFTAQRRPCGAQVISRALIVGLLVFQGTAHAASAEAPAVGPALAYDSEHHTLFKASAGRLYRSGDGGQQWETVNLPPHLKPGQIASVAVSAHGTAVYIAGPRIGLARSEDGGRHWSARNEGLPGKTVEAITTHADQSDTVYAYADDHGIFRSQDGGVHWKLMDAGPRGGIVRLVHTNMAGSMQTGWFFAATGKGVQRAMDCFCGWYDAGALNRPVRAITYDPRRPQDVYAATNEGLYLSTNGGEQWSRVHAPAPALTSLAMTREGVLYAAGDKGALFRSRDGAKTWMRIDAQLAHR